MNLDSTPALEFIDYSFKYDGSDEYILKNCNLKLNYGEIVLLSGFSGKGKSTLLYSANGIIPNFRHGIQEGEILINGVSIKDRKISMIALHAGSILQNPESQIIHAKADDEVAFACENLGMDRETIRKRTSDSLNLLGLVPDMQTSKMSGGQKQRLVTATTLAMGQKILLLDEPLSNMDTVHTKNLLKTLKDLSKDGYAILLVEHRIDTVLPFSDRVLWLNRGKVREYIPGQNFPEYKFNYKKHTPVKSENLLVSLQNCNYKIAKKPVLSNIDLSINKGERIIILGENGSGKTSLLRLIARLIKPESGIYRQTIINRNRPSDQEWFKHVGFVYQNPEYQLFMPSVEDEILYKVIDKDWACEILKRFGLDALKKQHPHSLSEGQKRKLSIALTLARKPELLLLDEPGVGQDTDGLAIILDNLNYLYKENSGTQIIVTHDRRLAKPFADRVIWMKEGTIFRLGGEELCDEYFGFQ